MFISLSTKTLLNDVNKNLQLLPQRAKITGDVKQQMQELNLVLKFARTMDGSRWSGLPVLSQGHQWEGGSGPLRMLTMEGTWRGHGRDKRLATGPWAYKELLALPRPPPRKAPLLPPAKDRGLFSRRIDLETSGAVWF